MKGTLYVGEQPIDVSRCSSLESEEVSDATHEFPQSFSFSVGMAYPKRAGRLLKKEMRRQKCVMKEIAMVKKFKKRWHRDMRRECRMIKQIDLLEENPKHLKVLLRCAKYKQRPPKKFRDMYSDVIRRLPGQHRFYEQ